jgi:Flp pilus assembly protein TadG
MRTIWSRLNARLVRDAEGSEIAEGALVLPLMFLMLLGIFWFGQAFSIYGAITRAAEVGARAGAAPLCSTCSTTPSAQSATNAANAVQASLLAANLDPSRARQLPTIPVFSACANSAALVGCNSASSHMCVQAPVQLSNTSSNNGAAGVCGISVTFEYPYQFWLPFTSLNKQQIWLQAAARVRMETY